MSVLLRTVFLVTVVLTSGIARADQDLAAFTAAVRKKLSALVTFTTPPDTAVRDKNAENVVLVDVGADGAVERVKVEPPVADVNVSAKFQRAVLMASPLPRPPAALTSEYSSIRLSVGYIVVPGERPVVKWVEVKGGFRYVAF